MDMVPETSKGEHGKDAEMLPADPDPDPNLQQERDVTAHQDYSEAEALAPIEEVLSKLQPLRARISQLLVPAGSHRVGIITGDYERRCMALMETELTIFVAILTTLTPQRLDDLKTKAWLRGASYHVRHHAYRLLREVDPSRQTLLRRATQCFHCTKSYLLLHHIEWLYYYNEKPCRYMHLPVTSSGLGHTPQELEAKEDALPLVGIDRPAKKILRWLSHQGKMDSSQRVISIVGPVGIGKTTLAMELCKQFRHENSGGRYNFQCNVMAQASRGPNRNIRLLQDILSQVSEPAATALSCDSSHSNSKVLVHLVSKHLRDKRYCVIINDIWEPSDWEEIKGAFPNNSLDSLILITTLSRRTAWACCSSSYDGLVHEIKPLSEMDSERLLLAKAVGSVNGYLPNDMKLLCDEILRRCDGIPLFIIGMADRLKEQRLQQQHQREDENEEHQRFPVYFDEQFPCLPERLEKALYSAFSDFINDDASWLLLLYMSMFPYGYKFEKDRLILKWVHEVATHRLVPINMLLSDPKRDAQRFFSQLVDRNFITCVASSNCKHKQGEAKACQWQVNHCMQKLLASKSAEMGFIFTTTTLNLVAASAAATTDRGNETSSRMPRRLALHHPDPRLLSQLETMDLSKTRSLAVSGTVSGIPLQRFVNLVVLDLEGWENLKDEDLLQVCRSKMFLLTYLSVKNTRVHKLPHEIKELRTLLTLDISYTQISELPHYIKELRTLQTLDISYMQISELPLELFELKHLQYLNLRGTLISQLPKQIVGLGFILSYLLIGGEETINSVKTAITQDVRPLHLLGTPATDLTQHPPSFVKALGDLSNLMVLAFTWSFHQSTDRDYCEALVLSITKWDRLQSLTIQCGLGCSMEFLGSLERSRAPRWLRKFKVTAGRFASVPSWIRGLRDLSFVQILVCNKQATDDLKILGALPSLQSLILGLDFIPGQPIVIGNRGFCELQRFSIYCPMPWLIFSTGAMQKMTYLQLKFCSTPASQVCVPSGMSNLSRLTEVSLCYNPKYVNSPSIKMTVEAVTQQVAEHRNPIDLFINGIEQDDVQQADDEVTENAIGTSSRTNAGAEDDAHAVCEEATAAVQCEITETES